jgi:RHS repeat-associated protein
MILRIREGSESACCDLVHGSGGTLQEVDNLTYKYKGNRLDVVSDGAPSSYKTFGFSEAVQLTTGEYQYDANGSMMEDDNKEITSVTYNHMNLVKQVTFYSGKKIVYTYDASGQKLRKVAYNDAGTEISRITYVGPFQYDGSTPVLSFMSNGEGRVVKNGSAWDYEYFHKDHLGNTRVVYGYQKQVDEYKATMESALAQTEESDFANVAETQKISTFNHTPSSYHTLSPDRVCELNGALQITHNGNTVPKSVGLAKMLQVTSGERVQLEVFARYQTGAAADNTLIPSIADAVTDAFGITTGESGYQTLSNNLGTITGSFSRSGTASKAYLFYIILGADHNYTAGQFGYVMVTTAASVGPERLYLDIAIPANGAYLYTYVVNQSDVSAAASVYFDDFKIVHTRNTNALQVVQTNDYYPFGLAINANTYQKEASMDNDYLYNGKELQDEHNLGWMDYGARMYMADIGRWGVVDPMAETMRRWSVYNYAFDNPMRFVDLDGMSPNGYSGYGESFWEGESGITGGPSTQPMSSSAQASKGLDREKSTKFGGGSSKKWNPNGGDEISYEEWIAGGGDKSVEDKTGNKYFSGAYETAQQGGTAYVFGSDGRLIESHGILDNSLVRFGTDVVFRDLNALKQFIAIVAGESSNNLDEATAMGQIMMNRMNDEGVGLTDGFINSIGGAGDFDAIGDNIYNSVMSSNFGEIFSSDFTYATRVQGAMRALGGGVDISRGAYFWNASSPQTGFNWNQVSNGTYVVSATYGASTFFKYADGRRWP